jgi:hypothetical protein
LSSSSVIFRFIFVIPTRITISTFVGMWFEQGVQQALQKAQNDHLLVMVFLFGSDEASTTMRNLLEQDADIQSLLSNRTIALALPEGSDNARLFSAICPVLVIPSTFFISHDGIPLEIVGSAMNQAELYAKIQNALRLHQERLAESTSRSTAATAEMTPSPTSTQPQSSGVRCEDGVCYLVKDDKTAEEASSSSGSTDVTSTSGSASTPEVPSTNTSTIEQKVQKTQRLLDELRSKKASAEAANAQQREKERIESAKAMQEAKRAREDSEMNEMIRQREKDALEAKQAKERVLALIRADQEERKAREKAEQEATAIEAEGQVCQRRIPVDRSDKATIQFRLPDGAQFVEVFDKQQSLSTVHDSIVNRTTIRSFTLYQTFPKRKFETEDYEKSFEQLQLTPNAALLVVEQSSSSNGITSIGGSFIGSLFAFVYASIAFFFNMAKNVIAPRPIAPTPPDQTESKPEVGPSQPRGTSSQSKLLRDSSNVKRLHDLPDDKDDDNNTWNGNSTQQM